MLPMNCAFYQFTSVLVHLILHIEGTGNTESIVFVVSLGSGKCCSKAVI